MEFFQDWVSPILLLIFALGAITALNYFSPSARHFRRKIKIAELIQEKSSRGIPLKEDEENFMKNLNKY